MQVTIDLPEDVARQFQEKWIDLPRGVIEILAIEGYRFGDLSRSQVARMLGFETPMAADAFLKARGVFLNYDEADLDADREALRHL